MREKKEERLKGLSIAEFSARSDKYDSADAYKMVKEDYEKIIEEITREEYQALADYGCGTGELLARLAKRYPGKEYVGIDITPQMIEIAKGKTDQVKYILGDSEVCALPADSMDVITCVHSFHHYPKPMDFLSNAYRVLRLQGRLIIRDNTSHSALKRWMINYIKYPIMRLRGKGDVHFYSLNEMRKLCCDVGFKVEILEVRDGKKLHCVARKCDVMDGNHGE